MAEQIFNGSDPANGPEKTEIIPAAMLASKGNASSVMVRAGFGKLATASTTFDPMSLLKSLRRRWLLAVSAGVVLATIVGVGAVVMMPPAKYTSRALLKVSMQPPKIIFVTQDLYADFRTFQNTQMTMIKSRNVLTPALRNAKVQNLPVVASKTDPVEWLESQIQVSFAGSELLAISMTSTNPDELEPIVNAVVDSYLQTVVENDHLQRVARLETLKTLHGLKHGELLNKRKNVRNLADAVGTDDRMTMVLKQQFLMEDLQTLIRELQSLRAELRRFNVYIGVIDAKEKEASRAKSSVPAALARNDESTQVVPVKERDQVEIDAAVDLAYSTDSHTGTLNAELHSLKQKGQGLQRVARNRDDPALKAVMTRMNNIRESLVAHKEQIRASVIARMNQPARAGEVLSSTSALTKLRDQVTILKAREADLNQEIAKQQAEVHKLNGQTIDLQNELEDIAIATGVTQKIGGEIEALQVELDAPRRITKWHDAESPRRKDIAKQYLLCGGAAFGAFALAMFGVSFWEMRAMRIDSVDDVVNNLGLSLVGALPALPTRSRKLSKADDQRWQGLLVESIDATRTMLLHASRVNSTRAVLITSAMKGEGKTSLAAHLATSLARAGRKTLLIDCDLRRPRLHQLFDVARVPGLCELLRGEAEINDVIRPTPADDLNMIPAGHCDGIALQSIAQDGFRDILTILKKRYDFIIIDSAPVLPVVDTMLLSQQVDAVLFSIMRDVSRVPHVHAAHERLVSLGVNMLGAVVSAAERRDYMHMYDYEYQSVETA